MDAFDFNVDDAPSLHYFSIVDPQNSPGAYPIAALTYFAFDPEVLGCQKLFQVVYLVYWALTDTEERASQHSLTEPALLSLLCTAFFARFFSFAAGMSAHLAQLSVLFRIQQAARIARKRGFAPISSGISEHLLASLARHTRSFVIRTYMHAWHAPLNLHQAQV